jgi:hypothetical protein
MAVGMIIIANLVTNKLHILFFFLKNEVCGGIWQNAVGIYFELW